MKHKIWVLALLFSPAVLGCGTPDNNVDETGYLNGERIYYSSADPLTSDPRGVTVVGVQGALKKMNGTLTLTNQRSAERKTLTLNEAQTFVLTIDAQKDDTIDVRLEDVMGGETVSLALLDALDTVPRPTQCPVCMGLVVEDVGNNQVRVDFQLLRDSPFPKLVYNEGTGDSLFVAEETDTVNISGMSGDLICIAVQQAMASPAYCEEVR